MDYSYKYFNGNEFNFNNRKGVIKDNVEFNSEKNFKFLKPVVVNEIFLSNMNWKIHAVGDKLFIKKLNTDSKEYEIKFTLT